MDNVIYTNIPAYLESCTTLKARIAALDAILNGMELALLKATTTGHFEEYKLDTGQTKNEIRYSTLGSLQDAYRNMLTTQQMLYARFNRNNSSGVIRLVDGKNFM
jgi:hypothetical protein